MTQPQLFDAGPVKITHERGYRLQNWHSEVRARLIGDGVAKQDPITGRWYEFCGLVKLRPALERRCRGCGRNYRSSNWTERKRPVAIRGFCTSCTRPACLPIGTKKENASGYIEIKTED